MPRASFNYTTQSWVTRNYVLPRLGADFVLLTPTDMLTRDQTWISYPDMIRKFERLPEAVPDAQLRAQINQYFKSQLGKHPNAQEKAVAAQHTIQAFPELIDYYIKGQEDSGDHAQSISAEKVDDTRHVLVDQVKRAIGALETHGEFYKQAAGTFLECLKRAKWFKGYIEN